MYGASYEKVGFYVSFQIAHGDHYGIDFIEEMMPTIVREITDQKKTIYFLHVFERAMF